MFIDMMVPHHHSAIEMAQVAQTRAEHPEIKEMASQIIDDQQKEIDQIKAWRQQWYGSSETPPMDQMPMLPGMTGMNHGGMKDMTQAVEQLRDTTEPFDRAFIYAMIEHHQMAVEAGMMAQQQAIHPELQKMGQQIVDQQKAEIDEMKSWRLEWFGSAEPEPTMP
ncbi:MAG: DUF305 domain-containing protein [Chloroflexota bacterium]|nr:DUF305 domain-containing protein [Chloroflexota bacterium]